ncbi:hypothetical protein BE20_46720 [Sorangium cellulosum]|uniref:hypothetical protein n=1 Tax=Sorangium sp. So ce185 TaxID=3133287 RepID=UPI000779226B|nr:hypothetical protein BE20_46720 [Sorangium cellulosum]
MGFYGPVTTHGLEATAEFRATGFGGVVGVLGIKVSGEAQNFTSGFVLVRDEKFVGGLRYNLMGWTGPLGKGDSPFHHEQGFDLGAMPPEEIVIASASETIRVPVKLPKASAAAPTPTNTGLPAPLMGVGSSTKLDYDEAYGAALRDLVAKWKPELLASREIALYRQEVTFLGLVLGAPTFRLTVTLIAPDKAAS